VALGEPIVKRGRKQQRLVDRIRNKVLAHGSNLKRKRHFLAALFWSCSGFKLDS
jgi:hypothetical protein